MPQTMQQHRTESHVAGEPAELFGKHGEPLPRRVYSYTAPDGVELWVALSAEGRVVSSVEIPAVPRKDREGLAAEAWYHSLGRAWIALETLDPCDDPAAWSYPNFWMA